jgi:hypothetical protein
MKATRWMRCSTTPIKKCTRTRKDKLPSSTANQPQQ